MQNNYLENQSRVLRTIRRVALAALAVNIALTVLKAVFGFAFSNTAMISDAAHSGMDSVITILVVIAASASKPHRDKDHNYGHEKREAVLVMFVGLFMLGTGAYFSYEGIRGLVSIQESSLNIYLIIVAAVSVVVKELLFQYTNYFAKKTKSAALKADAWGHRLDCVTSVAVIIGLTATHFIGTDLVESIAVIVVALFIARVAFVVLKGAYNQLVDKAADKATHDKITELALATDGVLRIDLLNTRLFGSAILVDMEIAVEASLTLLAAHEIAEAVHDRLESTEDLRIKHCNIHVNPCSIMHHTKQPPSPAASYQN